MNQLTIVFFLTKGAVSRNIAYSPIRSGASVSPMPGMLVSKATSGNWSDSSSI